jgi:hypothetical protein
MLFINICVRKYFTSKHRVNNSYPLAVCKIIICFTNKFYKQYYFIYIKNLLKIFKLDDENLVDQN